MSNLKPIYDVWDGNAEAMAADIEELGVTVRQWRNRGDIPSRAWPKIIRAATARGAALRLEDFLPPEGKAELEAHGALVSDPDPSASPTNPADNPPPNIGPPYSADNSPENIGRGGATDGPFPSAPEDRHSSGASAPICSPTNERSSLSVASLTSSPDGEAEAA